MKIKTIIFLLFYSITLCSISYSKEINKIIVKIDSELITNYDIKNKILTALILANKPISQGNINSLKSKSLEDLILNRLKKIELNKYNFKRDEDRINSYLNSLSTNNSQELKLLFEKNNLDFETFVDEIDIELRWRNLIYKLYSKKIEINNDEIEEDLKKKSKKKTNLVKYNLSEIEILVNNDDTDISRISQIQQEIKETGFENAVIKFSISSTSANKGSLGWVNSNSISENLLKSLSKMKIGEISKPIRKRDRVLFLKLNDKKVSNYSDININKLKEELIEKKKNELFMLYSSSLLSKLRNTKFIEYYK